MECKEAKEKLLEYREGQLNLEGRVHLEAHLLICGGCREELQAIEALIATIAALPVPDPSPGFAHRLYARIEEEKRGRLPRWLWGLRFRPAWAAALVTLLVAGAALWAILPLARCSMSEAGCWTLPTIDHPVGDLGSEEEVGLILDLWPRRDPDWTALGEGGDRLLAFLALGGDRPRSGPPEGGMEEPNLEEVVGIWTTALPGRKVMEVLTGVIELSDQELEALLTRLGRGSKVSPSSGGGGVEAGLLRG